MFNIFTRLKNYIRKSIRLNEEVLYKLTWDDTKKDIDWIKNLPSISPGRMAVGYNYIYVMTRILNELKPHTVLDMGLGISSTLINTYFSYYNYDDGLHIISEHDEGWINFYTSSHKLSNVSKICKQDLTEKIYKRTKVTAYKDLGKDIKDKKFSVISIDAPYGSRGRYSRIDILEYLPQILEESFVIVLDDSDRKGERGTIKEIEKALNSNNIKYKEGKYGGLSDCTVITSIDNGYLTSM